jgi:hypothetical protein
MPEEEFAVVYDDLHLQYRDIVSRRSSKIYVDLITLSTTNARTCSCVKRKTCSVWLHDIVARSLHNILNGFRIGDPQPIILFGFEVRIVTPLNGDKKRRTPNGALILATIP